MQKLVRYWVSGLSTLFLLVLTVVAMILAPRYGSFYRGLAVAPPTLTHWALDAYPYTPLFLIWLLPLYLLAKANPAAKTRQLTLVTTTAIVLVIFALWLAFLWIGIYNPIHDMNSVVASS